MPLTRTQKNALRSKISAVLRDNQACILINQKKINSEDNRAIRLEAKNNETKYLIIKNSLARISLRELGHMTLSEKLCGQTAIVYSNNPFKAARISVKAMIEFDEDIQFVGMIVDGIAMGKENLISIARLKSRADFYSIISSILGYATASIEQILQIVESKQSE